MKKILFTLLSLSIAFICQSAPAPEPERETTCRVKLSSMAKQCTTDTCTCVQGQNAIRCGYKGSRICDDPSSTTEIPYCAPIKPLSCVPTKCKDGYTLTNNTCVLNCPTGANCDSNGNVTGCQDGYYKTTDSFDDFSTICESCGTGVATCKNANVATSCKTGYYLTNQSCISCETKNAKTCTESTITQCLPAYWLNNNKCESCPDNSECDGTSTFTCKKNYYKDGNKCESCPKLENVKTAEGGNAQTGTLTSGATSRSQCLLIPDSDPQRFTDEKGTFELSTSCPIANFE